MLCKKCKKYKSCSIKYSIELDSCDEYVENSCALCVNFKFLRTNSQSKGFCTKQQLYSTSICSDFKENLKVCGNCVSYNDGDCIALPITQYVKYHEPICNDFTMKKSDKCKTCIYLLDNDCIFKESINCTKYKAYTVGDVVKELSSLEKELTSIKESICSVTNATYFNAASIEKDKRVGVVLLFMEYNKIINQIARLNNIPIKKEQ